MSPADLEPEARFDVLVANIVSGTLASHADELSAHLAAGARIALSGILVNQAQEVLDAWRSNCRLSIASEDDNWVLMTGRLGD